MVVVVVANRTQQKEWCGFAVRVGRHNRGEGRHRKYCYFIQVWMSWYGVLSIIHISEVTDLSIYIFSFLVGEAVPRLCSPRRTYDNPSLDEVHRALLLVGALLMCRFSFPPTLHTHSSEIRVSVV